jgi:hypothetical protein
LQIDRTDPPESAAGAHAPITPDEWRQAVSNSASYAFLGDDDACSQITDPAFEKPFASTE